MKSEGKERWGEGARQKQVRGRYEGMEERGWWGTRHCQVELREGGEECMRAKGWDVGSRSTAVDTWNGKPS
jgi:hypothetical protein